MLKSLKSKIMLPVLIIAAIGILILSSAVFYFAQGIITRNVETIAHNKVEKLVTILDDKVTQWKTSLSLLSSTDMVQTFNIDEIKKFTGENKAIFSDFDFFLVADKEGNYKSTQGLSGNIKDRDYFPKTMQGETVVSEAVISKSTGRPIIVVATPIKDEAGNIIGLFGGAVNLENFTNTVNAEKLGDTGYAYMINKEGFIMAHPNKEFILKENFLKNENESLVEITKKMIQGEQGTAHYTFNKQKKIASYEGLQTNGWSIAMTTTTSEVTKDIAKLGNTVIFIGLIILAAIAVTIYFLVSWVIKPISKMVDVTKVVAAGDLKMKVDIKSKDELGMLANHFNNMIENIRILLSEMNDMGRQVSSTSEQMMVSTAEVSKVAEQVAHTVSELAKGATEQAQSAQISNDQVNELAEEVSKISQNTVDSQKLTIEAQKTVEKGIHTIEYQKNKMLQSKQATETVTNEMYDLSEKSAKIGHIVKLISSIAEQTNLLALNAAIEAARAGEQGKGFAVVADEIRKLAEESNQSAKNIRDIINEIQIGVAKAVEQIHHANIIVDEQEQAVNETTNTFEEILQAVEVVTENIKEVTQRCENLNQSSQSVEQNIADIASITQQSAAGAEEVAASTEEQAATIEELSASAELLASLSNQLQKSIAKFSI